MSDEKLTKKELIEYWNNRAQIHKNMASNIKHYAGINRKRFLDLEKRRDVC
jgi:hypothetical protein